MFIITVDEQYKLFDRGSLSYGKTELDVNPATPVKVIYNEPYTIVYFVDGDKIIVKAEGDEFDMEVGLAMAVTRKVIGTRNGIKKLIDNAFVQEKTE